MKYLDIYNKLMTEINNAYGVCGLMGNLKAESAMRSDNLQDSGNRKWNITDAEYVAQVDSGEREFVDNVGFGLAQWTSAGRKASLLAFAKKYGTSIGDEAMQVDFIIYELNNGYKAVMKKLKNATSVKEASDYVVKKYERPANQSEGVLNARAKKGQAIYDEYATKREVIETMKIYKKGVAVQLSKNFKSTEFDCNGKGCCSETPIHTDLVKVLQQVRDHFGVSVNLNCGYRCPTHNAKVSGASKNSWHMKGYASDIVVKGVHPMRVARFIETLPDFNGRIGVYTWDAKGSGFVHVDVRGTNSRAIYTENNTDYDNVLRFNVSVKRGAKGKIVTVVERFLASKKYKDEKGKSHKYYEGKIDESCGPKLEKGIELWNAHHGRLNDASFGPKCWNEAFPI